ncbi:hypothetical protein CCYA_CCYA03G1105 [Cyanidiococcus yangmingshanensis]|nr:hypothetical protein CCYA_CCYA03G1105 [Cyanidiococcus yangmingshanensis]
MEGLRPSGITATSGAADGAPAPLHLIDARGELTPALPDWIAEHVQPLGTESTANSTSGAEGGFLGHRELAVVASLGPRGCGKSALLNTLFGSKFVVGRAFGRHARGTRGCFCSVAAPRAPWLLLLDSEGVDGRETEESAEIEDAEAEALLREADARASARSAARRLEGVPAIDRAESGERDRARQLASQRANRVAMLAATISDVLIMNTWYADIGRAEASGYIPLARTVFSEHLKLFTKESPARSKILFVVHDHDDGSPLEAIASIIERDLEGIWANQIEKPLEYRESRIQDHFDVEVVSLPHPRYRADAYNKAIDTLRARFLTGAGATGVVLWPRSGRSTTPSESEQNLLAPTYSKELPAEGFATYVDMVWRELIEPKEGSLPEYAELVAAHRCGVIYDRLLRAALDQISKWYNQVDSSKVVEGFGSKAQELLSVTGEQYDSETSAFATSDASLIRNRKRHELMSTLQNHIRSLFNRQIQILQNQAMTRFRDQMLALIADRSGMVSEFECQFLVRRMDEFFNRKAEELLVPSMRLSYRTSRTDLQNTLLEAANKYRDSPTAQLQAMTRMEKRAMAPPPKQRGVVIGFGLNTALRPRGYGNFQLIASTSRGPHTFNASICNDADLAEQEGHGKVPLLRWQPTVHFDIDI